MRLVLLFVALLYSHSIFAQNYFVGTSADGVEEMYIMSVTSNKKTKSIVVFDRIKPVEGKLAEFRKSALKVVDKETNTKNFDKLGYYRRKVQFNCKLQAYRVMECTYYDMGGKVLATEEFDEEETKWKRVPKGSMLEAEFGKVCSL